MPETIFSTTDIKILESLEAACKGIDYCQDLTMDIGLLLEPGIELELIDILEELADRTGRAISNLRGIYQLLVLERYSKNPERLESEVDERVEYTAQYLEEINDLQSRAAGIEWKSEYLRHFSMTIDTRQIEAQIEMGKMNAEGNDVYN